MIYKIVEHNIFKISLDYVSNVMIYIKCKIVPPASELHILMNNSTVIQLFPMASVSWKLN